MHPTWIWIRSVSSRDPESRKNLAEQMKEISKSRKSSEFYAFMKSKLKNYQQIRDKYGHTEGYCNICSETTSSVCPKGKIISHTHNSSKDTRIFSESNRWAVYNFTSCKATPHSFKTGIRHPVLVTSSILDNWQGNRGENTYLGDDIHVDIIAIPGATIKMLHHACMVEFSSSYRPIDVLLVGCLNDVMRGRTFQQIKEDLEKFKKDFISLKRAPEAGDKCTFAVSTPPYPPKVVALPSEERPVQDNRFETLFSLTGFIRELNRADNNSSSSFYAPLFHTWGMRTRASDPNMYGPRNIMESMIGFRESLWNDDDFKEMVHLDNSSRLRMGRSVVKYFMVIYNMIESRGSSKLSGMEIEKKKHEDVFRYPMKRKFDAR